MNGLDQLPGRSYGFGGGRLGLRQTQRKENMQNKRAEQRTNNAADHRFPLSRVSKRRSTIARVSIYRCMKRKILFQDFECCWGFPEYPFRAHARAEMKV